MRSLSKFRDFGVLSKQISAVFTLACQPWEEKIILKPFRKSRHILIIFLLVYRCGDKGVETREAMNGGKNEG